MATNDFLVEIGTEELPPKSLPLFSRNFAESIKQNLEREKVDYGNIQTFITPRRIAAYISNLAEIQQDQILEKTGPLAKAAKDQHGNLTPAALGFAKACQVPFEELKIKDSPKGEVLFYTAVVPGKKTVQLLPSIIKSALEKISFGKSMYWGDKKESFVRPVRWILMMQGNTIIPARFFDLNTDKITYGHRFHHPSAIVIESPQTYQEQLKQGYVIPDYEERKEIIRQQIVKTGETKGKALIDEELLNEVTGLVEWPIVLLGEFESRFLNVPQEAIISAMQQHQKCFPIVNSVGNLLPYFITVSNIVSRNPKEVIIGNERVIRARLSDAEFFYHTDLKHGLDYHLNHLKTVVFQAKLGTMYEKAVRIAELSKIIAPKIAVSPENAYEAGLLCKADLTTEMVGEFPELQGIMGYYYALQDDRKESVALAIKEHYQPRFAKDAVPTSAMGCILALADKIDTLIGIFGIHQVPTGEKDPYGLRRSALGILRILIENQLDLDLKELLTESLHLYSELNDPHIIDECLEFIIERLRSWYADQNITSDVFASVHARYPTNPLEFDQRIKAVQYFLQLPEAQSLAIANKRVSNILKQANIPPHNNINYSLLTSKTERELADLIEHKTKQIEHLCQQHHYEAALTSLAELKQPIDIFFDEVLVMVEDEGLRNNRLILLNNLRNLFLQIADISLLQI